MLNAIGYAGPLSVEWEDAGMNRLVGAPEALAFVRRTAVDPPSAAFDAAFGAAGPTELQHGEPADLTAQHPPHEQHRDDRRVPPGPPGRSRR